MLDAVILKTRTVATCFLLQLQRALDVFPAASLPTLLLCHTLVVADRAAEAEAAAWSAVQASGRSTEALSLLALLLQPGDVSGPAAVGAGSSSQQPAAKGSRADDASEAEEDTGDAPLHDYVALCLEVLAGDPWALGAVQGEEGSTRW